MLVGPGFKIIHWTLVAQYSTTTEWLVSFPFNKSHWEFFTSICQNPTSPKGETVGLPITHRHPQTYIL